MANLTPLSSADTCISADGGIYESLLVDCDEITDVVFDVDGQVTNFVMANVGAWEQYIYDDDDTAFYNQAGARANKKVTVTGQASIKYAGLTNTMIKFSNDILECCCVLAVHFLNSGIAVVQGIQYDSVNTTWRYTKTKPKVTPTLNTNTGADEDTAVFLIDSVGSKFSPATTLSSADILAL